MMDYEIYPDKLFSYMLWICNTFMKYSCKDCKFEIEGFSDIIPSIMFHEKICNGN